jgi:hypothetical protein
MRTPWSDELAYLLQWLTGHILSSIDQLSVGGKSPLTGGVKESNSGGTTGLQIAVAGYDSIGACIFAAFGFAAAPRRPYVTSSTRGMDGMWILLSN